MARAASARRAPTGPFLRGWMSNSSPTSVMTAMPVLGNVRAVCSWASRNSAQSLSTGCLTIFVNGASCTMRNVKSPSPQCARQSLIMVGSSVRYS